MSWNQPGNRGNDPWRGKDPNSEVQAFLDRMRGMFGGGGGGRRGGDGGFNPLPLVAGLLASWLVFNSFKLIDERERGVVLRFGEYTRMMQPGLNFKLPWPVEKVYVVQATQITTVSDQMLVLTRDENIVEVGYNVQYQVVDAERFLFGTRDPADLLQQITESSVREVIGNATLDVALNNREQLVPKAQEAIQAKLDGYQTGLSVTTLGLPVANPPAPVKAAFDDVIGAEQEAIRFQEQANAYAGRVLPEARGQAARTLAAAEAYRDSLIARATGDAARFSLLVEEYRKAPDVTRKRLYLETMQAVMASNPRVLSAASGNTLLLNTSVGSAAATAADDATPVPRVEVASPAVQAAAAESGRGVRPERSVPRTGGN